MSDDAIFRQIYPSLRRYAAVVASIETDPDDLVQEALSRRLRIGPLSDLDAPTAYLRRAITNLASNQRRSLGRGRLARQRLQPDEVITEVYPSDLGILEELSPPDRAILFLLDVEGFVASEVGEVLELTENAVRLRASRARRALRSRLEQEEL